MPEFRPGTAATDDRLRTDQRFARPNRPVRPSERTDRPVRNRDVGALFLFRDGLAARSLHGEIPAAPRASRSRSRLSRREGGIGERVRAARTAAARLANLRVL